MRQRCSKLAERLDDRRQLVEVSEVERCDDGSRSTWNVRIKFVEQQIGLVDVDLSRGGGRAELDQERDAGELGRGGDRAELEVLGLVDAGEPASTRYDPAL